MRDAMASKTGAKLKAGRWAVGLAALAFVLAIFGEMLVYVAAIAVGCLPVIVPVWLELRSSPREAPARDRFPGDSFPD